MGGKRASPTPREGEGGHIHSARDMYLMRNALLRRSGKATKMLHEECNEMAEGWPVVKYCVQRHHVRASVLSLCLFFSLKCFSRSAI